MAKKKSVILPIAIVIGVVIFIIIGSSYEAAKYEEDWLICDYPDKYNNYSEKLKFRFYQDILIGYYREETIENEDEEDLEKNYNYFLDIESDLEENDNFSYDVSKDESTILVKTFIDVLDEETFFDSYMTDLDINYDDDLNSVRNELVERDYSCHIVKK